MGRQTYVRILLHHLRDFGCNDFAFLAPCCCAFEDGDAFVHDGFEVLGFGVEGWDVGRRHCGEERLLGCSDMGLYWVAGGI